MKVEREVSTWKICSLELQKGKVNKMDSTISQSKVSTFLTNLRTLQTQLTETESWYNNFMNKMEKIKKEDLIFIVDNLMVVSKRAERIISAKTSNEKPLSSDRKLLLLRQLVKNIETEDNNFLEIKQLIDNAHLTKEEDKIRLDYLKKLLLYIKTHSELHFREYLKGAGDYKEYLQIKKQLLAFRESKILNSLDYYLHLLTDREVETLDNIHQAMKSIISPKESISEPVKRIKISYVENPSEFILKLQQQAIKDKWSKDGPFLTKLDNEHKKTTNIGINYKDLLVRKNKLQTKYFNRTYDMNTLAETSQRIADEKKQLLKAHPKLQNKIVSSDALKMASNYLNEINYLTRLLENIPGAKEDLVYISRTYNIQVKHKDFKEIEEHWDKFRKWIKQIHKKKDSSFFIKKFGDRETNHLFIETERIDHEYPKEWASLMRKRIEHLMNPTTLNDTLSRAVKELVKLIDLGIKQTLDELKAHAKNLDHILVSKISKLTSESPKAFKKVKELLHKEIKNITAPSKDELKKIKNKNKDYFSKKEGLWYDLLQEVEDEANKSIKMSLTFGNKFDLLAAQFPDPETLAKNFAQTANETIAPMTQTISLIESIENKIVSGNYHLDWDATLKAGLGRINYVQNLMNEQQLAVETVQGFFEGDSYHALNLLYTLGWQAAKSWMEVTNKIKELQLLKALQHPEHETKKMRLEPNQISNLAA